MASLSTTSSEETPEDKKKREQEELNAKRRLALWQKYGYEPSADEIQAWEVVAYCPRDRKYRTTKDKLWVYKGITRQDESNDPYREGDLPPTAAFAFEIGNVQTLHVFSLFFYF